MRFYDITSGSASAPVTDRRRVRQTLPWHRRRDETSHLRSAGPIDMRTRAEVRSPRRADTLTQFAVVGVASAPQAKTRTYAGVPDPSAQPLRRSGWAATLFGRRQPPSAWRAVSQQGPNFRIVSQPRIEGSVFSVLCKPVPAVEMSPGHLRSHPGAGGRRGEVEAELLLLDVVHEVPLVGEGPVVVPGELVQLETAGLADAEGVLEQIDQRLKRQLAGQHRRQGLPSPPGYGGYGR